MNIHFNLGVLEESQGNYQTAIEHYHTVLKHQPEHSATADKQKNEDVERGHDIRLVS